ncbi:hypothetical protein [Niastella vici]|nr:hypothetical protein [Niastella vici]
MQKSIGRRQALFIVLLLFVVSILLRLPNINRPLSKHHEYNSAVILVNIESWRQAGGGYRFHYVPLLNYQNPGDKCPQDLPNIDSSGNILYLSFGPGWYVIPYFIYQVFHLPVEPVYLQVINLFFNLAAVILLFLLCERLFDASQPRRYQSILLACFLFMFSPGILWYLGNGYVTTGIMMPFVIAALLLLIPMLQSADNIRTSRLIFLFLLIIVLVYIDWFVLFLSAVSSVYILFKIRKDKRYLPLLFAMAIACITAITILFIQFASYAGMDNLMKTLLFRFTGRSIVNTGDPFIVRVGSIVKNIVTSYFPLLLLLLLSLAVVFFKKVRTSFTAPEITFLVIYAPAVLLYNLILTEWSAVHEFALIPLSILLVIVATRLIITLAANRVFYGVIATYFVIACCQYYFINRPGKVSWDGTPFDIYKKLGQQVQQVPADYKLFMNNWNAVIDVYAHRNITPVVNIDSARAYMHRYNIPKAVWIDHRNYQLQKIVILR